MDVVLIIKMHTGAPQSRGLRLCQAARNCYSTSNASNASNASNTSNISSELIGERLERASQVPNLTMKAATNTVVKMAMPGKPVKPVRPELKGTMSGLLAQLRQDRAKIEEKNAAPKHRRGTKRVSRVEQSTFFHDRCCVVFGEDFFIDTMVQWMSDFKRREFLFHPNPVYLTTFTQLVHKASTLANRSNISRNDLPPLSQDRTLALHWVQSVASELCLERQTVQLACNAIDRILALDALHLLTPSSSSSTSSSSSSSSLKMVGVDGMEERWIMSRRRFQWLAAACLWSMYKSEEDGHLMCIDFIKTTGNACTVPMMMDMEQYVCKSLDFRWHAATIDDATTFLMQFILHVCSQYQQSFTQLINGSVQNALDLCQGIPALKWPAKTEQARLVLLSQWIQCLSHVHFYWRVATLADLAILDSQSLYHLPSAIAASILMEEFNHLTDVCESGRHNFIALTLFASDYKPQTLQPCHNWIKSIRQKAFVRDTKQNDANTVGLWTPLPAQSTEHLSGFNQNWSFRLQLSYPHALAVTNSTQSQQPSTPSPPKTPQTPTQQQPSKPPAKSCGFTELTCTKSMLIDDPLPMTVC